MPNCDYSRARAERHSVSAIEVIVYKPRTLAGALLYALLATALLATAITACGSDEAGFDDHVAFITGNLPGELAILDADQNKTEISQSAIDPKWAPNRARLAFVEQDPARGSFSLKIWERDAGEIRSLLGGHNNVVRHFWAPDSNRIAFESHDGNRASIYVVDAHDPDDVPYLVATEDIGNLELGNWSGDNRWVAMRLVTTDGPGIFRRNVAGVDEVRLTYGDDHRPRFSPDGRRIAFSRRNADGTTDIHIVGAIRDGISTTPTPEPAQVTADQGNERDFEWSPNGRYVSYVTDKDGDSEIFVLDIDGSTSNRLTQNRVEDRHPRWSRDDSTILFVSDADGDFDVFRMDLNSRDQRRVISSNDPELIADW